ncbi:hypothetical protein DUZ99_12480 [Xylanibacillus composti]|uniref:hypothetical protein n=1 Tax=Xylanibacillus composti TaxID=1572762 RepID=UPI0028F5442C|nr:hypothetical protein [Xylanibacillus composti]MDT9725787.1 hypothetical protein [Xylanibacillus composti]
MDVKRMLSLVTMLDIADYAAAKERRSHDSGRTAKQEYDAMELETRHAKNASWKDGAPTGRATSALSPAWDRDVVHHGSLAAASGNAYLLGVRTYRRYMENAKSDSSFDQLV